MAAGDVLHVPLRRPGRRSHAPHRGVDTRRGYPGRFHHHVRQCPQRHGPRLEGHAGQAGVLPQHRELRSNKVTVTPKGEREIEIKRLFEAPRTLVFDAMSKPEMMKQWFHGPPGWTLVTCDIDLRPGGKYRWVWRN